MPVLKNRAKMSTSATGTGSPITLGSAESGFQSFADAGVSNGNVVRYVIEDGNNFEIGTGTYTASGTTLTRTVSESNNSNNAINLSGSATVFISAIDDDIVGGPRGVDFDDNVKARFGNSNDLEIYHSGSASIIEDTGNGPLHIKGSTSIDFFASNGEYMAYMVENGAVGLYHNGSQKLNTTSTGASVTGKLTVDNSTEVDDALISIKTSTGTVGAIRFYCESGNAHYTELKSAPHSAYSGNLSFQLPASDGSSGQFLKTDGSGNLSFAAASGGADLYSANESSPSAQPSATGANAVAIGEAPTASGTDSFAVQGGTASGNGALAIGRNVGGGNVSLSRANSTVAIMGSTTSSNHYATAIGLNSSAHLATVAGSGMGAMALGGSYASGGDAFAAAIGTNSSSYGATGNGAVTIGYLSKTTSNGYALGKSLVSSGSLAVAIGSDATSSAARSVSLGSSNTASHTDAVVIGSGASSSAADEITLGHTDQTVRISSAYTLPQSDGSNGQVLTTNGSGALSFAAAGGGTSLDLYAENYTSGTKPSASGNDAVSIGLNSSATNTNSIAIGNYASAGGNGAFAVAAGSAAGYRSVAIASSAYASATDSAAFGFQAQATSTYAVSLGRSAASGSSSFASAIDNNSSSYGSSGANSIAIGYQAKSTNTYGVSLGKGATSTGNRGYAIGNDSTASGTKSGVFGGDGNTASGGSSVAIGGYYANARETNKIVFGGGYLGSNAGTNQNQSGILPLGCETTDATATVMRSDNLTASTTNQLVLQNNSAFSFSGTVIAREKASAGSDYSAWEIKGALLRDANAGSTVLGNGIVDALYHTSGASAWAIALSADTTNGCLKVEATGAASTNIRWVATIHTSEVIYA